MNIIKLLLIFSLFLFSCAHKTIKEKDSISIGYIILDNYIYLKLENLFDKAIRKNFLEKQTEIVRPVKFNFIPHSKIVSILEGNNIDYKNLNPDNLKKIGILLKNIDLIIFIEPVYIKIEDSYVEEKNIKCSYRKGFALMDISVYRNDIEKITFKKEVSSEVIKKVCDKDIFKSLDIYPKNKIKQELLYKIFDNVSGKIIREI